MNLQAITHKPQDNPNPKFTTQLVKLQSLLAELQSRVLPDTMVTVINSEIDQLNASNTKDPKLYKQVFNTQQCILNHLEKSLKIVPKGYYQRLWMVLGMSAFGIPLGVALGTSQGNMGLLGIGLPIGMVIGIAVGTSLDKKAAKDNRQLQFKPYGL
ncbi:hypothetical protein [Winogradskyella aurantia]|uniref:Glycine zipper family protein n=1 Tax=Winogradskyella aurantia TaxID=1915063 RepID=A0A265V0Z7_9FLAO|nr:hypothetical protein [Winogradskyella aurantia]OZV70967.1 hypothetical protein CA834_02300 [Winogradskyella aurantia]